MATIKATKAGNWSDTSVWDLGRIPQADDDVALAGYVIVWDTSITRIPATGTLTSISSTSTAGQITLALDDVAFHGGASLYATTITAARKPATSGMILVTGTTDHVLTVTGDLINGDNSGAEALNNTGTGTVNIIGNITTSTVGSSTAYGVRNTSTGTINVTGNITAVNCVGLYNASTGAISVDGIVTGGSNTNVSISYAAGIANVGNGEVTLSANSKLIQGTYHPAYIGKAPAWQPASTSYAKFYVGALFGQAANTEFPQVLSAANIKAGVTSGSVTGTYVASGGTARVLGGGL